VTLRPGRAIALTAILLALPGAFPHPGFPADGATLVLLVRHAEKAAEPGDDPPLSAVGAARAQALAAALRDSGVTAVVTTQLRRTRDTAQPIATGRGLTPEVVPIDHGAVPAHADAVAAAVRRHAGGVVLVVGHSNTIPAIIAALGGPHLPEICDAAYSNLFILQLGGQEPRLILAHYGVPDPDLGPDCKTTAMHADH
jgi:broad specificity phosphatase PhoE